MGVRAIELSSSGPLTLPETAKSAPSIPSASPVRRAAPAPPVAARSAENVPVSRGETLSEICKELGACVRCGLHKARKNVIAGEGNPKAALVFVGGGPGEEEDKAGRPFVDDAGKLLTDIIVKGMKLKREDVYICTVVKCLPPEGRAPLPEEALACAEILKKQLAAIKPKVIVALGDLAAQTLLATAETASALRGVWREYDGIPLMATLHPAELLKNPAEKKKVWEDIQKVMAKLG